MLIDNVDPGQKLTVPEHGRLMGANGLIYTASSILLSRLDAQYYLMRCKVKSFTMSFEDWTLAMPTFSDTTTIRLPVKFRLELEEGSKKSDCCIEQSKMGRVETNGTAPETFPNLVPDGPVWWNGSDWHGGNGSWSWWGNDVAKFEDEPGFPNIKRNEFPVFYGGVARAGPFRFRTVVIDKTNQAELASLEWGILINVRSPDLGGFYLNGCSDDGELWSFKKP